MRILILIITAVGQGFLMSLSFPNIEIGIIPFIMFIPSLFIIKYTKNYRESFLIGWLVGISTLFFGYNWIQYTIGTFGGTSLPGWSIPLIFLLYCIFFSLKFPVIHLVAKIIKKNFKKIPIVIMFPLVVTGVEFLIPELFPFYFGNMFHKNMLIMQIVEITSVNGLTFLSALSSSIIFEIFSFFFPKITQSENKKDFPYLQTTIVIFIFLIVHVFGYFRIQNIDQTFKNAPELKIGSIQPNTPMSRSRFNKNNYPDKRKNDSIRSYSSRKCIELTEKILRENKDIDLVVWPESATSFYYQNVKSYFKDQIKALVKKYDVHMFINDFINDEKGYYNNSDLIKPPYGQVIGDYQKMLPLAFGEYNPFKGTIIETLFPQVIELMDRSSMGNSQAGTEFKVLEFETNGKKYRFAPNICYELIIPELIRKFTSKDAEFIINATNDRWFGETKASTQHFLLGSVRAIENRMYLYRSTNSGISTIFDPVGRNVPFKSKNGEDTEFTELFSDDYMIGTIKALDIDTFYKSYGNVFAWIISIAGLILFVLSVIYNIMENFRKVKSNKIKF